MFHCVTQLVLKFDNVTKLMSTHLDYMFLIQTHVKNAEKYLKTSPLKLKFTPDWDPAGDEFSRAATAYKVLNIV